MMLSGILSIDKPQGWTSHDVVARVRRLAGQRQVGHAGTLDPLATGVLLLVLGRATRLSWYLMAAPKTYRADIVFGVSTVTDDAEAPIAIRRDASWVELADVERCLASFVGEIWQLPPAYAAVRHGGQKLYALARRGIEVRPEQRRVTIHRIDVERWEPPRLRARIECEAGTYVRALARDLGEKLGVGGYLHALRRAASGEFTAERANTLDRLGSLVAEGGSARLGEAMEPPDRAVLDWPALAVREAEEVAIRHGQSIALPRVYSGDLRVYSMSGALLALASGSGTVAKPFLVMSDD